MCSSLKVQKDLGFRLIPVLGTRKTQHRFLEGRALLVIWSVSPRREPCFERDENSKVVYTILRFMFMGSLLGLHVSGPKPQSSEPKHTSQNIFSESQSLLKTLAPGGMPTLAEVKRAEDSGFFCHPTSHGKIQGLGLRVFGNVWAWTALGMLGL